IAIAAAAQMTAFLERRAGTLVDRRKPEEGCKLARRVELLAIQERQQPLRSHFADAFDGTQQLLQVRQSRIGTDQLIDLALDEVLFLHESFDLPPVGGCQALAASDERALLQAIALAKKILIELPQP